MLPGFADVQLRQSLFHRRSAGIEDGRDGIAALCFFDCVNGARNETALIPKTLAPFFKRSSSAAPSPLRTRS